MEVSINNQIDVNVDSDYRKVKNTVEYFCHSFLRRFKKNNLKIEVWVKNKKASPVDPIYACGLSVKRPGKKTIYVEKSSRQFGAAVKNSTLAVSRILGGT